MDLGHMNVVLKWMYLYVGSVCRKSNVVWKRSICTLVVDVGGVLICSIIIIFMLCFVLFCVLSVCVLLCFINPILGNPYGPGVIP